MNYVKGDLVLVGINKPTLQVYYKGQLLTGIHTVKCRWNALEAVVTLVVTAGSNVPAVELRAAGIKVKEAR